MTLTYKAVHPFTRRAQTVRELYLEAFPANERFPYGALLLASQLKGHALRAIYDGEDFVGLVYYCYGASYFYLLFFAIAPSAQSQGYGGRVMADLKGFADQRTFVLMAEALDETADNAHQRQRRIAFYDRHGFAVSDYDYIERGDVYHILTHPVDIDSVTFEKFAKKSVFWLIQLKIVRRDSTEK